MNTNEAGIAVIQAFESCLKLTDRQKMLYTTYLCPAGVLTIGWGTTRHDVPSLRPGEIWTRTRCDDVFAAALKSKYEAHIAKMVEGRKKPLDANQFAALVSWAYNCGGPASSAVWPAVRAGDDARVPVLLSRWNKVDGRVLAGLVRRRKAEGQLYAGDVAGALKTAGAHMISPLPMPQMQYDTPPKPNAGEIVATAVKRGGKQAGGLGAYLSGLAVWWDGLTTLQQGALVVIGCAVAFVVCGVVFRKVKRELEAWA